MKVMAMPRRKENFRYVSCYCCYFGVCVLLCCLNGTNDSEAVEEVENAMSGDYGLQVARIQRAHETP